MGGHGSAGAALAVLLAVAGCGKTGHLAEVTLRPGTVVQGRGGRPFAELPTAVQQQAGADIEFCRDQASVTVPDDKLALTALLGVAAGVLTAHGAAAQVQGGVNGLTNAVAQAGSDGAVTDEILHAAEWKASDCRASCGMADG